MQQPSVREGLDEIFTVNRLGLPASLRTCLTTTNIIDSTHSGIRQRTRRVTNWKNGEMALRWSAVAFVETEKNYRRITGYEHLWMSEGTPGSRRRQHCRDAEGRITCVHRCR